MRIEKTIDITCANCGKIFQKIAKEHKRQIKNGNNRFFCNLSCSAFTRNAENPPPGNPQNLIADNRRDQYTFFKWFVNHAKSRNKERKNKREFNITVEFLKKLWEEQNRICPFTGWNLILPIDSEGHLHFNLKNASLDRIDNAIGYIEGNVRFVCVIANLARNKFIDDQLIEFCKAVANNG
jgi:hypothetical protein